MRSTPKSKNTRSASKQQEEPRLPSPPHDDQETQTSYTLPSEHAIQRMQRELVLLRETITKQNEKITSLERKMCYRKNWMTRNSTPAHHAWLLKVLEVVIMKQKRP